MRRGLIMAAVSLPLLATLCGCGKEKPRQPVQEAVEQGKADAERALRAPAGTMDREKALLGIRAKEQTMREAGYDEAADDYIQGAQEVLWPVPVNQADIHNQ